MMSIISPILALHWLTKVSAVVFAICIILIIILKVRQK
jgi:hypothetical protein